MPLRLAAQQPHRWRIRHVVAAAAVGAAALYGVHHFIAGPAPQLAQAPAVATAPKPAAAPAQARWTLVFERPEKCDEACDRVLETLHAVARDPASGIPDGDAQIVVKTVAGEPARDIIVFDPAGQPVGFIVHNTDAGRIVSGLATFRAASAAAPGTPLASR